MFKSEIKREQSAFHISISSKDSLFDKKDEEKKVKNHSVLPRKSSTYNLQSQIEKKATRSVKGRPRY